MMNLSYDLPHGLGWLRLKSVDINLTSKCYSVLPVYCLAGLYALRTPFAHVLFSQQTVATKKVSFLADDMSVKLAFYTHASLLYTSGNWNFTSSFAKLCRWVFHSVKLSNYNGAVLSQNVLVILF